MVTISAPTSNASDTLCTSLIDAASISVPVTICAVKMSLISFIRPIPSNELSSTLPTNGEMYVAPAFAASIACAAENIRVTLTLIPD